MTPTLDTGFERHALPLTDDFRIARGTQESATIISVEIGDGEHTGIGAGAPSTRYGETPATVSAVLPDLLAVVEHMDDPFALDAVERELAETIRANPAARAAVSIALHDLVAKRRSHPLYRHWGLTPTLPPTSVTIGLDSTERMREKTRDARSAGFELLKVKLGTDRDLEIIEAVREAAPDATIRVDANEAWRPNEAVRRIRELDAFDVQFVEQPVSATNPDGLTFVHERSVLPIAADESCVVPTDVPGVADSAAIANIKLMKCGGLRAARRMIATAHAHGMAVMLGCMVESNASIAAACHLAPLVEYVDLDGSLLLAADPFEGVSNSGDTFSLDPDVSGTGARR